MYGHVVGMKRSDWPFTIGGSLYFYYSVRSHGRNEALLLAFTIGDSLYFYYSVRSRGRNEAL